MPINFPNSPNVADTVISGSVKWTWNGTSWVATGLPKTAVSFFLDSANTSGGKTYTLVYQMPVTATLDDVDHKLDVGTINIDIKKNANSVNGLINLAVTTVKTTNTASTNNTFAIDDELTISINNPSANAENLKVSINFTKG